MTQHTVERARSRREPGEPTTATFTARADGVAIAAGLRAAARSAAALVDWNGTETSAGEIAVSPALAFVADILWPRKSEDSAEAWAILDGASDERIYGTVRLGRGRCLYQGRVPWPAKLAAPYLLRLNQHSGLSLHILERAWMDHWGIFLRTESDAGSLLRHLQRYTKVRVEGAGEALFRYFDGRTLEAFLPTCSAEELKEFFGPILSFVAPGRSAEEAQIFRMAGATLNRSLAIRPALDISAPRPEGLCLPYVPSTPQTVDEMLKIARIQPEDVLLDLGSGDGRIVIAAAKQHGIRAIGVDIDTEKVSLARKNAEEAGVDHLVSIVEGSFFTADLSGVSIVTMYLLPEVNEKLRPKLLRELKPGSRIVTNRFRMGDLEPDRVNEKGSVFCWVVPEQPAAT